MQGFSREGLIGVEVSQVCAWLASEAQEPLGRLSAVASGAAGR